MINEYLFLSNDYRAAVEAYSPDSVSVDISNIEKTPLWTVTFSVPNKNSVQSSLTEALKSIQPLNNNQVLAETLRNATIFQTSPAMENLRKQLSQLSEVMRPYQQMLDDLKEYNVLQEPLSSITDGLPHNLNIDDDHDKTEKDNPKIDNDEENPEEDTPSE